MYKFYNENPLGVFEEDCTIRSLSCATNKSWDEVYDKMSNLAQFNGTMMDDREFIRWYLDTNYKKVIDPPYKVYEVAEMFKNNIVLCTMKNHICCIKYGIIYDTFNPSDRIVEDVWIVK